MKTILIPALMMHACTCHAQSILGPSSQPYLAITAFNLRNQDGFSFVHNVAGLSNCMHKKMGLYADQKFGMKELSHYAAVAVYPNSQGVFGFQINYAGFANYREYKIGFAYSKSLGHKLSAGLQFFYQGYRVPAHSPGQALGYEAGLNLKLTEQLRCGIIMRNPYPLALAKTNNALLKNETLNPEFSFGLGYDAGKNFHTTLQIVRIRDRPVNVLSGFAYQIADRFFVRAGITTGTESFFAGAGIRLKQLQLHLLVSVHPQLGLSPGMLLLHDRSASAEKSLQAPDILIQ